MAARDETVLGILGVITAFGALRFIVRPFNGQAPLRERGVVIRFKKLSRVYGSLKACWFNRTQKGLGYCRVDLQDADVKAVDAAAVLDPFVQAMVIGRLVGSTIVSFKSGHRWPDHAARRRLLTATQASYGRGLVLMARRI